MVAWNQISDVMRFMVHKHFCFGLITAFVCGVGDWVCGGVLSLRGQLIDFNQDIRPILADQCYPCHGPDRNKRKADLRLDLPDGLTVLGEEGAILVPGDPEASLNATRGDF